MTLSPSRDRLEALRPPQPAPHQAYRLPDVVLIGAAKSGTTSLAKHLGAHPAVCLANPKEPEYFSHDENLVRGPAWYDQVWEAAQFEPS